MPSQKLSALGSIGTGQVPTDLLYIVDVSAGAAGSLSITLNDMLAVITRGITDGALRWGGKTTADAVPVSAANSGAIYFNQTVQGYLVSENTGAYDAVILSTKTQNLTNKTFLSSVLISVEDAGTNNQLIAQQIGHNSTGTPAANFGVALQFLLESSTTASQTAANIVALWRSATHVGRDSALRFDVYAESTVVSPLYMHSLSGVAQISMGSSPPVPDINSGIVQVSGSFRTIPVQLTDAATITVNASQSNAFYVTLGGNRTLQNPTFAANGQVIVFEFIQDGTGNRTITLDTKFAFGTDITGVTLSTAAGDRDFMTVKYNSVTDLFYVVAFVKGY